MSETVRAYLILIFGVICIGFSAIFVKWAAAPGAVAGFYRMVVASIILAPFFLRRQQQKGRESALGLPRRECVIALIGGLFFAIELVLWNTGVLVGEATNPTLMGNLAPIWVGLGALLFFREKLPALFWIGLAIAVAGAALIVGLDVLEGFSLGLGTLFGVGASFFYGGYFLITQRGRQELDALSYTWIAAGSSAIALLVAAWILEQPLTGYSSLTYLNLVALGLVVQVFGQFSFSYALGYLPASVVAPAGLGQPIITALLAWPLLGESVGPLQALGGLAVIAGVYTVHRSRLAR